MKRVIIMRKYFYYLLFCLFPLLAGGCSDEEIEAESVIVNPDELKLLIGEEYQLSAIVLPENTDNKTVTWYSSYENVATVSLDGTVKAVNAGRCFIIARSSNLKFNYCHLTVERYDPIESYVPVESISLTFSSMNMVVGQSLKLTASVAPSNATDKSVTWYSDNKSVADVSNDGTVTAVNNGTATITAVSNNGGISATCVVTVRDKSSDIDYNPYGDEVKW